MREDKAFFKLGRQTFLKIIVKSSMKNAKINLQKFLQRSHAKCRFRLTGHCCIKTGNLQSVYPYLLTANHSIFDITFFFQSC
jgi:hypothetical protein